MQREALEKVLELQDDARKIVEISPDKLASGTLFTTGNLRMIGPNMPETVEVESLTGLVDFVNGNRDGVKKEDLSIIVHGPRQVSLVGKLGLYGDGRNNRPLWVEAKMSDKIESFPFGRFVDHETFVIKLLTLFKWEPLLENFIRKVQKIKLEVSAQSEDTGVGMKETRENGVKVDATREIIKLRPYRTFSEAEQPETSFIFRVSSKNGEGVTLALLECDGGAWINQARASVKEYLEKALPDIPVFA